MSKRTIQLLFFITITLVFLVLSFFIFKPYLGVIFLASVLAVTFHPLYQKFLLKFGGQKNIAALFTILIIIICIIIPLIFLSASLLNEAVGLYNKIVLGEYGDPFLKADNLINSFKSSISLSGINYNFDLQSYARGMLDWVINNIDSFFAAVFSGLFKFILMLLSLYYLLLNGEKIRKSLIAWSPLPDKYDDEFLKTLRASVDAVMRGRLLVSVAQGFFIGLGFWIFGVGNPVLWGFVGGIASLVPILGTSIVTLPAALYLLLSDHIGLGIGMLLWSVICVGLIDNVLSYFFFRNRIKVHPIIVLFSIFGGVEVFGAIGFLMGPVIVSAFLSLMKIYPHLMFSKDQQ